MRAVELRARLVIDCMGQRSPIVAQVRGGAPPDGVCVVVGSCADGFDAETNCFGDVIFADSATEAAGAAGCPTQYFWEAFPASASATQRTTYLFTYMDLDERRPSVDVALHARPLGVMPLLDEESRLVKGADAHFAERARAQLQAAGHEQEHQRVGKASARGEIERLKAMLRGENAAFAMVQPGAGDYVRAEKGDGARAQSPAKSPTAAGGMSKRGAVRLKKGTTPTPRAAALLRASALKATFWLLAAFSWLSRAARVSRGSHSHGVPGGGLCAPGLQLPPLKCCAEPSRHSASRVRGAPMRQAERLSSAARSMPSKCCASW